MASNKNVRLTFDAWSELRKLKFRSKSPTYTSVFELLLSAGEPDFVGSLEIKNPGEVDKNDNSGIKKEDKTIVITLEIHEKLTDFKTEYMIETGATSRGKGAVSISDIVLTLIKNYAEN